MFYGDYLRQKVFAPLGMNQTRVISDADIVLNRASGYESAENGVLRNQTHVSPALNRTADGSLYSTVLDLAKWDGALYGDAFCRRRSSSECGASTLTATVSASLHLRLWLGEQSAARQPAGGVRRKLAGVPGGHVALRRQETDHHIDDQSRSVPGRAPDPHRGRSDRFGSRAYPESIPMPIRAKPKIFELFWMKSARGRDMPAG